MENTNRYLLEWEDKFNAYCELEAKCIANINCINDIKNNLKTLLGNQKKDDIVFYRSIIDNSYFYLFSSLKIRKIKFIKDLNYIWSQIDERKQMSELNKSNFTALLKDYKRMTDEVMQAKQNNTILTWVKDDKVENLQDLENDLNEIMEYHIKLIEFFTAIVELEKVFYCGK